MKLTTELKAKLAEHIAKWPGGLDIAHFHRDLYAIAHQQHNGRLPLIVGQECYEYFGEWVYISQVRVYESVDDHTEVVVENRSANMTRVEFRELSWKYGRILGGFIRESGIICIEQVTEWFA